MNIPQFGGTLLFRSPAAIATSPVPGVKAHYRLYGNRETRFFEPWNNAPRINQSYQVMVVDDAKLSSVLSSPPFERVPTYYFADDLTAEAATVQVKKLDRVFATVKHVNVETYYAQKPSTGLHLEG